MLGRLSACESDDAGLNEGTMVFELTENDTPVGGTQEFVFDTPRSYTIKAENVVSATTERPEGWVVKTNLRDRQCIIEPPMAAYLDGNESGSIVFTLTSPAGPHGKLHRRRWPPPRYASTLLSRIPARRNSPMLRPAAMNLQPTKVLVALTSNCPQVGQAATRKEKRLSRSPRPAKTTKAPYFQATSRSPR